MLKNALLVAVGGALGSTGRYLVAQVLRNYHFPWATFLVNIAGCFIIGAVLAFSLRNSDFEQNWRVFLASGICGGFTTYSAFSLEMMSMLQQNRIFLFAIYLLATVVIGLIATWLGYTLFK